VRGKRYDQHTPYKRGVRRRQTRHPRSSGRGVTAVTTNILNSIAGRRFTGFGIELVIVAHLPLARKVRIISRHRKISNSVAADDAPSGVCRVTNCHLPRRQPRPAQGDRGVFSALATARTGQPMIKIIWSLSFMSLKAFIGTLVAGVGVRSRRVQSRGQQPVFRFNNPFNRSVFANNRYEGDFFNGGFFGHDPQ